MIEKGDLLWIDTTLKKPYQKHKPPDKSNCEACVVLKSFEIPLILPSIEFRAFNVTCIYKNKVYTGIIVDSTNNSRNQRHLTVRDKHNNFCFKLNIAYIEKLS